MSKKKKVDQKRKAQLAERTQKEYYKFQLEWAQKNKQPAISVDDETYQAELKVILEHGLFKGSHDLSEIIAGVKRDLEISPIDEKCSLNGSLIPYMLGITSFRPMDVDGKLIMNDPLLDKDLFKDDHLLRIDIYYDNEVRMKVYEWAKAKGYECIIMAYRPIIKLQNIRVTLQRVIVKNK